MNSLFLIGNFRVNMSHKWGMTMVWVIVIRIWMDRADNTCPLCTFWTQELCTYKLLCTILNWVHLLQQGYRRRNRHRYQSLCSWHSRCQNQSLRQWHSHQQWQSQRKCQSHCLNQPLMKVAPKVLQWKATTKWVCSRFHKTFIWWKYLICCRRKSSRVRSIF